MPGVRVCLESCSPVRSRVLASPVGCPRRGHLVLAPPGTHSSFFTSSRASSMDSGAGLWCLMYCLVSSRVW